jgi:hypothetical protein
LWLAVVSSEALESQSVSTARETIAAMRKIRMIKRGWGPRLPLELPLEAQIAKAAALLNVKHIATR